MSQRGARLRKVRILAREKKNCRGGWCVEWFVRIHERIQVCVPGLRPAHHSRLRHEREENRMPDLLPKDCRSTSPSFDGFKTDNIGVASRQTKTASEWELRSRAFAIPRQGPSHRRHPISSGLHWKL